MAKSPNWLDVEHRPIENGAGDREIPAEGRIGWLSGKSRVSAGAGQSGGKRDAAQARAALESVGPDGLYAWRYRDRGEPRKVGKDVGHADAVPPGIAKAPVSAML